VDVVDDVNALLKLGVGDSYRLEHIKQAYIQNKSIWVTDENYLKRLREKYLIRHSVEAQTDTDEIIENEEPENKEIIHCWKCGKKCPLGANFCMFCGTSLFEVGATKSVPVESKSVNSKNHTKSFSLKIPIIIGIPVLILLLLGVGYTQGFFDNVLERSSSSSDDVATGVAPSNVVANDIVLSGEESDSRCGPGTFFDSKLNSCVVGTAATTTSNSANTSGADSRCGPGTSYDSDTNSCVVG